LKVCPELASAECVALGVRAVAISQAVNVIGLPETLHTTISFVRFANVRRVSCEKSAQRVIGAGSAEKQRKAVAQDECRKYGNLKKVSRP
jgi:hypothetical protein